jgi:hypothetical protein
MHLSEFASGGFADHGDNRFEEVFRSGAHQAAPNPAAVND